MPSDEQYNKLKADKELFPFIHNNTLKIINFTLKAISALDRLLNNLNSYKLFDAKKSETSEVVVYNSIGPSNITKRTLKLFKLRRFREANERLLNGDARFRNIDTIGHVIIPNLFKDIMSEQEILSGEMDKKKLEALKQLPEFSNIVEEFVRNNKQEILLGLEEGACNVVLSNELLNNTVLRLAVEYILGTIYPYLKHLRGSIYEEALGGKLKIAELNCHRNINIHDNMYVAASSSTHEEGLLHYASKYIKTIRPVLESLRDNEQNKLTEIEGRGSGPLVGQSEMEDWISYAEGHM